MPESEEQAVGATDQSDQSARPQFLEMQNVNVARGDRIVLHDINLGIRTGEHVAILGPNGCGKSTLILTMSCQIYPIVQEGMHVRIFGRERWDLTQLRKHFGIVSAGTRGLELPGERTAVTTGLDAVIAGFFSASTLWPNLHVTAEMRERAVESLERMEALHLQDSWSAKCPPERSAASSSRAPSCIVLINCCSTSPPTRSTWLPSEACARLFAASPLKAPAWSS